MLSFGTDAWTSPNLQAYIAVIVHFEQNGVLMCLLLNLIEVARSHSSTNIAATFVEILDDFGIGHNVRVDQLHENGTMHQFMHQILGVTCHNTSLNNAMIDALAELVVAFPGATN